jgi:hypothetical protein
MKIIYYSFENFLREKHSAQYEGLDDEMEDNYNAWVESLDGQELMDYADECIKNNL